MKTKIFAFLICILLCLSMTTTAFADSGTFVYDDTDTISGIESVLLNTQASAVYNEYGVGVYFVLTGDMNGKDTISYTETFYQSHAYSDNGIMLLVNDDEWYIYRAGTAAKIFSESDTDKLWDVYKQADQYSDGIANYIDKAKEMLKANSSEITASGKTGITTTAANSIPDQRLQPRLVDNAQLLSDSEASSLLAKLDEISVRQNFDVVVVTVNQIGDKTPEEFADDFYDYNGYGYGENRDGVLLLVNMDGRKWHVSTTGYGITAITDAGLEYMSDRFLPAMKNGEYASSFTSFADLCDQFVTQAKTGKPYDTGNLPNDPLSWIWIPGSLFIGMLFAWVVCGAMKSKLKSVRFQPEADDYVKENSLNITDSNDLFLYAQLDRRLRPKDDDSGGSGTHFSSSGTEHGGGGGSF